MTLFLVPTARSLARTRPTLLLFAGGELVSGTAVKPGTPRAPARRVSALCAGGWILRSGGQRLPPLCSVSRCDRGVVGGAGTGRRGAQVWGCRGPGDSSTGREMQQRSGGQLQPSPPERAEPGLCGHVAEGSCPPPVPAHPLSSAAERGVPSVTRGTVPRSVPWRAPGVGAAAAAPTRRQVLGVLLT